MTYHDGRRSGFPALIVWCVAMLIVLAVGIDPRPKCRDYGGWHGYDDGESFGYKDWFCQLPRGHRGDHWALA